MSNESASCGCSSACAPAAEPIVCTLGGHEQQRRRAAEFQLVFRSLTRTELLEHSFRWYFDNESGLEVRLRELAQSEHECCRFFDFQITLQGDALVWETRAPERAATVLREFMRLPETLRGGPPLEEIRRLMEEAGLTFSESSEQKSR